MCLSLIQQPEDEFSNPQNGRKTGWQAAPEKRALKHTSLRNQPAVNSWILPGNPISPVGKQKPGTLAVLPVVQSSKIKPETNSLSRKRRGYGKAEWFRENEGIHALAL